MPNFGNNEERPNNSFQGNWIYVRNFLITQQLSTNDEYWNKVCLAIPGTVYNKYELLQTNTDGSLYNIDGSIYQATETQNQGTLFGRTPKINFIPKKDNSLSDHSMRFDILGQSSYFIPILKIRSTLANTLHVPLGNDGDENLGRDQDYVFPTGETLPLKFSGHHKSIFLIRNTDDATKYFDIYYKDARDFRALYLEQYEVNDYIYLGPNSSGQTEIVRIKDIISENGHGFFEIVLYEAPKFNYEAGSPVSSTQGHGDEFRPIARRSESSSLEKVLCIGGPNHDFDFDNEDFTIEGKYKLDKEGGNQTLLDTNDWRLRLNDKENHNPSHEIEMYNFLWREDSFKDKWDGDNRLSNGIKIGIFVNGQLTNTAIFQDQDSISKPFKYYYLSPTLSKEAPDFDYLRAKPIAWQEIAHAIPYKKQNTNWIAQDFLPLTMTDLRRYPFTKNLVIDGVSQEGKPGHAVFWSHSKNETYYVPGRIVINLTARYNSSWGDNYPPNVFPNPGYGEAVEEKCYECIKSHEAIRYSYHEEAQPEFGTNWQEYWKQVACPTTLSCLDTEPGSQTYGLDTCTSVSIQCSPNCDNNQWQPADELYLALAELDTPNRYNKDWLFQIKAKPNDKITVKAWDYEGTEINKFKARFVTKSLNDVGGVDPDRAGNLFNISNDEEYTFLSGFNNYDKTLSFDCKATTRDSSHIFSDNFKGYWKKIIEVPWGNAWNTSLPSHHGDTSGVSNWHDITVERYNDEISMYIDGAKSGSLEVSDQFILGEYYDYDLAIGSSISGTEATNQVSGLRITKDSRYKGQNYTTGEMSLYQSDHNKMLQTNSQATGIELDAHRPGEDRLVKAYANIGLNPKSYKVNKTHYPIADENMEDHTFQRVFYGSDVPRAYSWWGGALAASQYIYSWPGGGLHPDPIWNNIETQYTGHRGAYIEKDSSVKFIGNYGLKIENKNVPYYSADYTGVFVEGVGWSGDNGINSNADFVRRDQSGDKRVVLHGLDIPWGTIKDDGTYDYYIYEITCKAMLDSTQINPSYVTGNLDFVVGQGTNSDRTTFGSPREFQGIHVPWHYSGENVGTHTDSEGRTWVEQKINFSGNDNQAGDAFTNPSGAGSFFTFAEGFVYISLGWQTTQINQVAYVDDVKIKRVEKVEVLEKNINSSYNIKSISGLNDGKIKLDFSKPMKNEHYVVAGTVESGILNVTEKNKNYVKFSIVDDIASTGELKFQEGALKDFKNCNITIH